MKRLKVEGYEKVKRRKGNEVKWSEVKRSEVKWSEIIWMDLKRDDKTSKSGGTWKNEEKGREVKWSEVKWRYLVEYVH